MPFVYCHRGGSGAKDARPRRASNFTVGVPKRDVFFENNGYGTMAAKDFEGGSLIPEFIQKPVAFSKESFVERTLSPIDSLTYLVPFPC